MPVLTELTLYPVKSCAGIALREATVTAAGLMSAHIYDREWMVVDANGNYLTQRDYPQMATIVPRIKADVLGLRAPGMMELEIPLDLPDPDEAPTLMVKVWDDVVKAYDCDATTAVWFSHVLGVPCRLVRFHPHAKRFANPEWTGGNNAPTLFGDGFPILVVSQASLHDLNQKLQAQGRDALPMNRFRPNVVIDGVNAFEEDYAGAIAIGEVVLQPVKPCPRCTIPSVDQSTGKIGANPLDVLQTYRANPKIGGAAAFGMNAILRSGEHQVLRVGQEVLVDLAF